MTVEPLLLLLVAWWIYTKVRDERTRAYWQQVRLREKDREIQRIQEDTAFYRQAVLGLPPRDSK